jgi:hypothetical protein
MSSRIKSKLESSDVLNSVYRIVWMHRLLVGHQLGIDHTKLRWRREFQWTRRMAEEYMPGWVDNDCV